MAGMLSTIVTTILALLVIPAILLRLTPMLPLSPSKRPLTTKPTSSSSSSSSISQSTPNARVTRSSKNKMAVSPKSQQPMSQLKSPTPSSPQSTLDFYLRTLIAVVALFVSTCYGAVAALMLRLFGLHGLSQWTAGRCYKWLMWMLADVGFEVVAGREHLRVRPAVFMGNHQSELDVLLLGCIFPRFCSVTAKSSLKWVPFLGWFMSLSNTVFVDRANRSTALAAFDSAAAQMHAQHQSVFIFPEGTRSYAAWPTLLPFKKGGFHLAIQAQVPVVAIVCANYSWLVRGRGRGRDGEVAGGVGNDKGAEGAGNDKGDGGAGGTEGTEGTGGVWFGRGVVPVSVLPPIPTTGLTAADVDSLSARVREAMLTELQRLSGDGEVNA